MKKYTVLILAAVFVWGCQSKPKECDRLIGVIQPIVTQFDEFAHLNPQNVDQAKAGLSKMVSLSEQCENELKALEIDTEKLRSYADEYQTMCAEVAVAAGEMMGHLEAQKKLEPEIQKVQKSLQEAAGKFEKACNEAEDASACKTVAQKMDEMPDDPVAQMEEQKRVVGELKAIEIENAGIKAAVGDIVAAQERLLELVKHTAQLEKKMRQTEQKIDDATAGEEELVSGLNSFCQA